MAMRKRSLKTSFEITGPDALFHMMSIRFRSDTKYPLPINEYLKLNTLFFLNI